jgi:hypothetical protein
MMTKLTAHFTLEEMTQTQQRMDNTCPPELMPTLLETAMMLERIRAALSADAGRDIPLTDISAYRCIPVNRAVGSNDGSEHPKATACDFKARAYGSPFKIATFLAKHQKELDIGQLILEFDSWIHVSTRVPVKAPAINRTLTYRRIDGKTAVLVGIQ